MRLQEILGIYEAEGNTSLRKERKKQKKKKGVIRDHRVKKCRLRRPTGGKKEYCKRRGFIEFKKEGGGGLKRGGKHTWRSIGKSPGEESREGAVQKKIRQNPNWWAPRRKMRRRMGG